MYSYTLTDVQNKSGEVLEKANTEPILLIDKSQPSYIIMSVESYQQLLERLKQLEDTVLGQATDTALTQSKMIGTEAFTSELEHLANGEA